MARKVVTGGPQRRAGVNRAQLKAHAARQAMTAAPTAVPRPAVEESAVETTMTGAAPLDYTPVVPRGSRRATLSHAQEFAYIRRDLIRLTVISALLLVLLLVLLVFLR